MKISGLSLLLFILLFSCKTEDNHTTVEAKQEVKADYAIVIHGGAGTIKKENMSDSLETAFITKLNEALDVGIDMLEQGAFSVDVVEKVINVMEDSPLFNAGKGSVYTHDFTNEMDASIMDGSTMNAGAVGSVMTIRNPISAAKSVMQNSKHVMMIGRGAEEFATTQSLDIVSPEYFKTDRRWDSIHKIVNKGAHIPDKKHGTVGCVILDKQGRIAAGTSTGGMTNKRYNRIGDSPIIGAGTYADENCGISCTGHGEYFIRYAVAHDMAARIKYLHESIQTAADEIINKELKSIGASGGLIGLDKYGNITMTFNTPGMYRGYAKPGERIVRLYKD